MPQAAERANDGLHAHVASELHRLWPDRATRILDLGCGTGAFLARLERMGYARLTGVDIAVPDVPGGGVTLLEGDLDSGALPLAPAAVDVVVSIEVFEHLENPGAVLAELARIVRPGGQVLLTTPNLHSLEARARLLLRGHLKQFDRLGDPTHIAPVFLFPFRRLAHRHGFELLRFWGHPVDGRSPTSRPGLRWIAGLLRLAGMRGEPAGDQLCILLERSADHGCRSTVSKREAVTSHYGRPTALPA